MSRRMYDFVPLDVADRDWQKHRAETADDVLKAAIRGEKGKGISFHAWVLKRGGRAHNLSSISVKARGVKSAEAAPTSSVQHQFASTCRSLG